MVKAKVKFYIVSFEDFIKLRLKAVYQVDAQMTDHESDSLCLCP